LLTYPSQQNTTAIIPHPFFAPDAARFQLKEQMNKQELHNLDEWPKEANRMEGESEISHALNRALIISTRAGGIELEDGGRNDRPKPPLLIWC
jgi:hypothetical protein